MAKILPAGANVNLNLGEDPFDRLLKTIQVASQVQGVMNQASLQRDRRDAIKNESIQTMMLNSLTSMDKSDMNSIAGTESALTEMRDKFISENPHLTDDINTFYSTTLSTTIAPIKKVHQDFERDKNSILSQIDNMDKQILALPDDDEEYEKTGVYLDGSNTEFKDTFSNLAKSISQYKMNMAMYDKVMPDLNADLATSAEFANSVLSKLPSQLIGVFDGTEQELASQLLRGEITPPMYDAALKNYYAKTSGRTSQIVMPRLAGEMNSLYKDSYLPGFNFLKSIQSGNVALFDPELKGTTKQKSYFDDSTGIYYYNGTQLNEQTDNPKKAKEAAESAMKAMLRPVEIKIKKKDSAYRDYSLETQGEAFSYAQNIAEGGLWPWDPGALQFEEDILEGGQIEGMVDKNNNGIPDYIERADDEGLGDKTGQEKEDEGMGIFPKTIGGLAVTGFAAKYGGATIDIAKDIHATTKLNASQITQILEDKTVERDFNAVSKVDNNISKLQDIIEEEELKGKKANSGKIRGLQNRIKKLEQDKTFNLKSVKKYAKKFKVPESTIQQIFKTKSKDKFLDFFKLKSGVASKAGTFMQKGTKYVLPYQLSTAVYQAVNPEAGDWETRAVGAGTTLATKMVINKVVENKQPIKKAILAKIKDKTKKAAAKRALQWTLGTSSSGGTLAAPLGVLTGAMFLYDLADIGVDVYRWWTADEIAAAEQEIGKKIPKQSE